MKISVTIIAKRVGGKFTAFLSQRNTRCFVVSEPEADATQSDTAQAPSLRPECRVQTYAASFRRGNLPRVRISQGKEDASVQNALKKILLS